MTADEKFERFALLANGLAEHWDIPLTPTRRQKLKDYVASIVEDFRYQVHRMGSELAGWDDSEFGELGYVCDYMDDFLWDHSLKWVRHEEVCQSKLGDQVECCIRAALDIAVAPSCGVIGFTVGDLRRACGGTLPDWVSGWFDPPLTPSHLDTDGVWA